MRFNSHFRSILTAASLLAVLSWAAPAQAQKFYPDDPIWAEPPPEDTIDPQMVVLAGLLEYFTNQFTNPGERQPEEGVIPAQNINTLGEVPDSPWFTNRHGRNRLTLEALVDGPGSSDPPSREAPWRVLTVKPYGGHRGILMADADDAMYLLRFDPKSHQELQTGAAIVSSKFYYAAGYNVPENYLVYFDREDLLIGEGADKINSQGNLRELLPDDIDNLLKGVDRDGEHGYRAVATRLPNTEFLGNYRLYGTRSDDPNDIVAHEHRRDLRGMWVLHAWLGNSEFSPAGTMEAVVTSGGTQFIRRYITDTGRTLGAGMRGPKEAREGNEYRFRLGTALENIARMGVVWPAWANESYPRVRGVGRFGGDTFDADAWTADVDFATWVNRLPDDLYWGAKIVMSFTDEEIRAIVESGGYSDPRAPEWISDALIKRRDEIGRDFFSHVLPLDNFRVVDNRLMFDDLMVVYGLGDPRALNVAWFAFDNDTEVSTFVSVESEDDLALPPAVLNAEIGEYLSAGIEPLDHPGMSVVVYLRREESGFKVVGIDRHWPGKIIVEPSDESLADVDVSRFNSFDDGQKALLDGPALGYNETTGRNLTTEQWFDQLTLSERTTFDAIINALRGSDLTDEDGEDLGTAFDLIVDLERIAGQYSGRGGDEQFRLYVFLREDARETLERSTQFFLDHENTVYHMGYPISYRQEGNVPNIQFSMSEDGLRGDIDVDYRSSKSPQALFNGHLTAANSDIRAGDNFDRHAGRWEGLVNWWQEFLGNISWDKADSADLLARKAAGLPTPLPPDRPIGAAPEELYEAAQEFLTDWLVREKVDEAMLVFSRRAIACINIDDGRRPEILDVAEAIVEMREIMTHALHEVPRRDNLSEALEGVVAQTEDQAARIQAHPFELEFTIIEVRNQVAADYMCSTRRGGDPPSMPGGLDALGTYYGVIFRFKARDDLGGAFGLLWDRQEGSWRIVSYATIQE